MKKPNLQILALGGVVGPILLALSIFVGAALRPDYNQISEVISELGATSSPNATLMNYGGFILPGICLTAFSIALLLLHSKKRPLSVIATLLLLFFGLGTILAGIFSCDPGCPTEGGSTESQIHMMIGPLAFMAASFGIALHAISFRSMSSWRSLWPYTAVSGLLAVGLITFMLKTLETSSIMGLLQRLLLLVLFAWSFVVGLRLYKMPRE